MSPPRIFMWAAWLPPKSSSFAAVPQPGAMHALSQLSEMPGVSAGNAGGSNRGRGRRANDKDPDIAKLSGYVNGPFSCASQGKRLQGFWSGWPRVCTDENRAAPQTGHHATTVTHGSCQRVRSGLASWLVFGKAPRGTWPPATRAGGANDQQQHRTALNVSSHQSPPWHCQPLRWLRRRPSASRGRPTAVDRAPG
jgi:hypothetical protein